MGSLFLPSLLPIVCYLLFTGRVGELCKLMERVMSQCF